MKRLILFTLFGLLLFQSVNAQAFYSKGRRDRNWMLSFGIGASTYHGDLNDFFFDQLGGTLGSNFGLGIRRKLGSALSLRLDMNYYSVHGSDARSGTVNGKNSNQRQGNRSGQDDTRFIRNLSFSASNLEVSLQAVVNIIPVKRSFRNRPLLNLYLFGGIGFTTNNPKADHPTAGRINLRDLNTEALPGKGYSGMLLVIPTGIGVKLKATRYIDLIAEGGWRWLFSDYLDDVSTVYPSQQALAEADRVGSVENALILYDRSEEGGYPERQAGNTRGNPEHNDVYYILQLRLEMYLPYGFMKGLIQKRSYKPKFR